jgi:hypothetical protein
MTDLPWPSDEEIENAPRLDDLTFYDRFMLAYLAVEPPDGMGATTSELVEYLRADESVAPITPPMRALLAALLAKIPDRKLRGDRGRATWSADEIEIARQVLEDKKKWRRENNNCPRVPPDVQRDMIENRIDNGDSPFHQACRADPTLRNTAIRSVERHITKRDRL